MQRANLDLVAQAATSIRTGFARSQEDPFARGVVVHFFNPNLEDLHGWSLRLRRRPRVFRRLHQTSDSGVRGEPHSLAPYGDELVVTSATNTVSFAGTTLDVDAFVAWRIVDGRIREAWDIPAINIVRLRRSDTA